MDKNNTNNSLSFLSKSLAITESSNNIMQSRKRIYLMQHAEDQRCQRIHFIILIKLREHIVTGLIKKIEVDPRDWGLITPPTVSLAL